MGRFISRDPLGIWGDPGQVGNGQSYCGNNPVNRVDPLGLQDDAEPQVKVYNVIKSTKVAEAIATAQRGTGVRVSAPEELPVTGPGFYNETAGTDVVIIVCHGDPQAGLYQPKGPMGMAPERFVDQRLNETDLQDVPPNTSAPKKVIIVGCEAKNLADDLYAAGVETVIASDKKIPEEAMKEWAAAFVRTVAEKLGEGELLDDVVTAALAAASEAAQRALMRHGGMAKNWEMPEVVEPPAEAGD